MPKSAPGSSGRRARALADGPLRRSRGFTLIELLVVVAIIAIASSLAALALRDPAASQLEREAARLGALLESARAEARSGGMAVRWQPRNERGPAVGLAAADFQFLGLPPVLGFPTRWLVREVRAEVVGAPWVVLGPEPLIGAQRIRLALGDQQLSLATDGLAPFSVIDGTPAPR